METYAMMLRRIADMDGLDPHDAHGLREAADTIDAQAARIAELEAVVEVLQNAGDRWSKRVAGLKPSDTLRRNEVKACAFNEIVMLIPTRAAAEAAKGGG